MTTAVTGASGHLGANLVRKLLARGRKVRALIVEGDALGLDGLDVERVEADVRDPDALQRAFTGVEVVYHLAAVISIQGDPDGTVHCVNVHGSRNVARAALQCGVRRLIHTSSIHALDPEPREVAVDECRPAISGAHAGAYDASKAAGEAQVQQVVAEGLDAVVVNPTGAIGPCDYRPSRMGKFFADLAHCRLPALVEGGFNWVDVRDVARGMLLAEEHGRRGERYILGGSWHTLTELGRMASAVTGASPPLVSTPMWLARPVARVALWAQRVHRTELNFTPEAMMALASYRHVAIDKARAELGYEARPVEDTVRDLYTDFAERGCLPQHAARYGQRWRRLRGPWPWPER